MMRKCIKVKIVESKKLQIKQKKHELNKNREKFCGNQKG